MRSFTRAIPALIIASLLAACSGGGQGSLPSTPLTPSYAANAQASCGELLPGDDARCFAWMRTDIGDAISSHPSIGLTPQATSNITPSGYGPADLRSAYALPSTTAGAGQTVAIVDAYNDPNAENDMNVYRAQYGIAACTTANGCFKKVNQTGGTSYPTNNASWGQEISLDLDMVSAVCPNCHIILVEASTASNANLQTAVNTAVSLGANVVSNSYGGNETAASNSAYNHPGTMIVASAGDSGTGPQQPCSFSTVICVGGTALNKASNARGWSETAWTSSGSGCSAQVAKPSWQHDATCTKRSESDVSAVADPNTGVAVYDSYGRHGSVGWLVFGGTSVSSPVIGAVYALAANEASQNYASAIWSGAGAHLFDVTSGSNGSCSIAYICNARVGYDGPTGWGTPNGIGAF